MTVLLKIDHQHYKLVTNINFLQHLSPTLKSYNLYYYKNFFVRFFRIFLVCSFLYLTLFWSIWSGQIQIGPWRAHWKSPELISLFRIHRFHTLILLLIVGKCEFAGHILFARTNWSYNSYNLYICMWQNGPDIVRKENTNRGHFSRSERSKKF